MNLIKISKELDDAFEDGRDSDLSKHSEIAKSYLAILKTLREFYLFAHWVSKSDPFYGDHSLFQRLYEEVEEQIDGAAEKFIGLIGEDIVFVSDISALVCKFLEEADIPSGKDIDGEQLAKCGIKIENMFLKLSEDMYDNMKEDDSITLGLDDMIMANFNSHEDTMYLLKQRVK